MRLWILRAFRAVPLLAIISSCGCSSGPETSESSADAPTADQSAEEVDDTANDDLERSDPDRGDDGTADYAIDSSDETADLPFEDVECPLGTGADVSFIVAPYLQHPTPTSMAIRWETKLNTESRVEWGPTEALGNRACGGTAEFMDLNFATVLHEVVLTDLEPGTRYFYQVHTGELFSELHSFRTVPSSSTESSIRIVAMSDMQRDSRRPEQFAEIVRDGVIAFATERYSVPLEEALNFAAIPGDLVDNGWVENEWIADFFAGVAPLAAYVPIVPAPGNHEGNTPFYFRYFRFPENGSEQFHGHWYTLDFSNLRFISLDSNDGYRTQTQLDWLDGVLADACSDEAIDFVFAQLHHPHLSELWIDGEIDYTGDVINRLETFSDTCGKPSAHFFGHTHGYSRGQSRDHRHLWVNVATAGGAIDRWGEYEQRDYDEFTVSQDEYGFVIVEVDAGDEPEFRLQRITTGDPENPIDNQVADTVRMRRYNNPPAVPELSPSSVTSECGQAFTLAAEAFVDDDGGTHSASHWQVHSDCDDFTSPLVDDWLQSENWYNDEDTQLGDDLTDNQVKDVPAPGDYCWRVRYRDSGLAWSSWSATGALTVTACD